MRARSIVGFWIASLILASLWSAGAMADPSPKETPQNRPPAERLGEPASAGPSSAPAQAAPSHRPMADGPAYDEALAEGARNLAPLEISCLPGGGERITLSNLDGGEHPLHGPAVYWMAVTEYRPAPQPITMRPLAPGECGMPDRAFPASVTLVFLYRFQAVSPHLAPAQASVMRNFHVTPGTGAFRTNTGDRILDDLVTRSARHPTTRELGAFVVTARPVRCHHRCDLAVTPPGGFVVESIR